MSTVSQTPKIKTARTLNVRNANLLVIAALVVAIVVFFTSVAGSPAAKPIDHSAYMLYRQGEWLSVPIPPSVAIDMNAYHLSERTLIDPQAGMATFLNSERTSVPVRFTKYQLSEWFGK